MTRDIEEFRILKTLIEIVEPAVKLQRRKTQLVLHGWQDEVYKQKKRDELQRYEKALEWLRKQWKQ